MFQFYASDALLPLYCELLIVLRHARFVTVDVR